MASTQRPHSTNRESATPAISYSYDQLGQLTGVDYGNGSRIAYRYDDAGNLILTEILINDTRALRINYTSGSAGSLFTIRGSGFPAKSQILILINSVGLSPLVTSDGAGDFVTVIDTTLAGNGLYIVTAMVVPASGSTTSVEAAAAVSMVRGPISNRL